MNKIKEGFSKEDIEENAVEEIANNFQGINPNMLLFFSSSKYDIDKIGQSFENKFSDCNVIGCTTSGEIVSGKMLKESVVAMAFDESKLDEIKVNLVENIGSKENLQETFANFKNYYEKSMKELDPDKYVGIILIDGLSGSEEKVMDSIGNLTNILFIGASAGDDLKFKETKVYANTKSSTNAAVLAIMKPVDGFDILKTQSFDETGEKLIPTKVDEEAREVLEFNNKPAVEAYAEAVGTSPEKVSDKFMHNPVGLMVEGKPYVRSPQRAMDKKIKFYCNVKQGMELSVLESTDIVEDTKKAVNRKVEEMGEVTAIINFHCILRTLELEQIEKTEEYGKIFTDIPTIGFSTYGEEYIGHINQTSTMLFFK